MYCSYFAQRYPLVNYFQKSSLKVPTIIKFLEIGENLKTRFKCGFLPISTGKFLTCFLTNLPEKCGREVQEKRDLGFLKETESGSGCESKAADHQRTPRNF